MAKKTNDIEKAQLVGYAYYSNVHAPQKDEKRKKYSFKTTLVLTDENNKPIIFKDAKTGQEINMLKRAKELGLTIKKANDDTKLQEQIGERPFVEIKKEKKFVDYKALSEEKQKKFMQPVPVKFRKGFKEIGPDTMIGNGSLAVVSFSAIPYDYEGNEGVQAYIQGMSIINLVSYQQNFDADSFDFEGVEMTDPNEVDNTFSTYGDTDDDEEEVKPTVSKAKKASNEAFPFDDDVDLE